MTNHDDIDAAARLLAEGGHQREAERPIAHKFEDHEWDQVEPEPVYEDYEFEPTYGNFDLYRGTYRGTPLQERPEEREERMGANPQVNAGERGEDLGGTPKGNDLAPSYKGQTFPSPEHGYRFATSETFLFGDDDEFETIWGDGETPIWPSGESLMLVGPPGVGKSTLTHNVMMGLLLGGEIFGYPIKKIEGNILYLAMDRPKQIKRAFMRLMTDRGVRNLVQDRVLWHLGPMPFMIANDTSKVAKMCKHFGVTVVVIDSIKDMATNPSDEVQANAYNQARQKCLADGIEWIELHHNRKSSETNKKPRSLDDVYGSRFLTAGAGSILSLWGESGDEIVELSHIRPPGNALPPMKLALDKEHGRLTPDNVITMDDLLKRPGGITVRAAAVAIFGKKPTESQIRNTRNKLKRMVDKQEIVMNNQGEEARFMMPGQEPQRGNVGMDAMIKEDD